MRVNHFGSPTKTSLRGTLHPGVTILEHEAALEGFICQRGNLRQVGLLINTSVDLGMIGSILGDDSGSFVVGSEDLGCNMHLHNDDYDLERHHPEYATQIGLHDHVQEVQKEPSRGFTVSVG